MIYKQTKVKITDNSGAKVVKVFHLCGYSAYHNCSSSGELVLGSVISYKAGSKIIKKQICQVLLVTSKKNVFRKNGSCIKFDENRGIILSDSKKLLGTRIFGPISKDVKRKQNTRVLSLISKSI